MVVVCGADVLQQKYMDTSQLYSSLLSEREEHSRSKDGAGYVSSDGAGSEGQIEMLEQKIADLQKTMNDQVMVADTSNLPLIATVVTLMMVIGLSF